VRLSTVRLFSPQGVTVDLLFASSGIEAEIVARATDVDVPAVGTIRVARAEERAGITATRTSVPNSMLCSLSWGAARRVQRGARAHGRNAQDERWDCAQLTGCPP
jgi:hypothetical protein